MLEEGQLQGWEELVGAWEGPPEEHAEPDESSGEEVGG